MRLLIIEDEQELCLMIHKVLKSKGYSVDYCFDGEEGMELLEVENYDLVIPVFRLSHHKSLEAVC